MANNGGGLKQRRGAPSLSLPSESEDPLDTSFSLSSSGTFKQGDLKINKTGIEFAESENTKHFLRLDENKEDPLSDIRVVKNLGAGSSGVVRKIVHVPTNSIFAMKLIQLDIKDPQVRKQILLELRTLHKSVNEYIVSFHGAFYCDGAIHVVLEYMDASILDVIKHCGPISEHILAKIASQVLRGLAYLHSEHVTHRDIKPSNLLVNFMGDVKIADFGVSGQLADSIAKCTSWVGTVTYMSPERIRGEEYGYDTDLWSLGLALLECALGKFPYPQTSALGFWELLDYIVEQPAPIVDTNQFSEDFADFISICLHKNPKERTTAKALLEHPWITGAASEDDGDMREWILTSLQVIKAAARKRSADEANAKASAQDDMEALSKSLSDNVSKAGQRARAAVQFTGNDDLIPTPKFAKRSVEDTFARSVQVVTPKTVALEQQANNNASNAIGFSDTSTAGKAAGTVTGGAGVGNGTGNDGGKEAAPASSAAVNGDGAGGAEQGKESA